ncbi:MAG: ArsR/SmtB family transcription factor [Candidatus Nanohalobium sp.]
MELDFKTVKALSSPKRIEILNETIDGEMTPTDLSEKVGRSKSTVSSHLQQLCEAELLEKDSEEGRRRVVYHPTEKTEAILEGRSRKVKFSILSSLSTGWIGSAFLAGAVKEKEKTGFTAMDAASSSSGPENLLLAAGAFFLFVAVSGVVYGLLVSRVKN